jgi:hypothetical protein
MMFQKCNVNKCKIKLLHNIIQLYIPFKQGIFSIKVDNEHHRSLHTRMDKKTFTHIFN